MDLNKRLIALILILISANVYILALQKAEGVPMTLYIKPVLAERYTPKFEEITAIITAYNTTPGQTQGDPCIAADGTNICGLDNVLACPRRFPFGTKFEIEGKIWICHDRTNSKYDCSDGICIEERIDLNFNKDIQKARQWGKKTLTVKIYDNQFKNYKE